MAGPSPTTCASGGRPHVRGVDTPEAVTVIEEFYANLALPFGDTHKNTAAYLGRLMERPSFARTVREAQPYLALMPK